MLLGRWGVVGYVSSSLCANQWISGKAVSLLKSFCRGHLGSREDSLIGQARTPHSLHSPSLLGPGVWPLNAWRENGDRCELCVLGLSRGRQKPTFHPTGRAETIASKWDQSYDASKPPRPGSCRLEYAFRGSNPYFRVAGTVTVAHFKKSMAVNAKLVRIYQWV